MKKHGRHFWGRILCVTALFFVVFAAESYAQTTSPTAPPNAPHGTCTSDPQFKKSEALKGEGIITTIVEGVKGVLNRIQGDLYNEVLDGATPAIRAAITLYIAIYGLMFTVGMIQVTVYDFTVRMVKLGVVVFLISGNSWTFFNQTVVAFFNDGTDEWIGAIASVATGESTPVGKPFATIDSALATAVSAKTAVSLMAAFFTPPYGPIIGILLSLGMTTFVKAILQAAWVYLMSLIVKSLLFGMAPIFLACLLFENTKYLFTGWLNQVINVSLQPILLFTFLAFFVTLIEASISNMMKTPVCWTESADSLRGTPFSINYWRFALCPENNPDCQPFGGKWTFTGPQNAQGPVFPIPILGVLVLVLLADLCAKFNEMVPQIAKELSGGSLNLAAMGGAMSSWFNNSGSGGVGGGGGGDDGKSKLPNMGGGKAAKNVTEGARANTPIGTRPGLPASTPK